MATKYLIGLMLLLFAIPVSVAACCVSRRMRDAAFFLMTVLVIFSDRLTITFANHWYRGTTNGFEYSVMDVLAVGVLAGSVLFPRPGERHWFWPAGLGLMLLFFAYAAGNVALAVPKIYGLFELSKILRGLVFFLAAAMFVRSERELSLLVVALGCAVCFEGALAIRERLFMGIYRTTGSLDDPNSYSMFLCTVSPVFVAAATSTLPPFVRRFSALTIGVTVISIVLTLSRAGIPIFAFVMLGATVFCVSWRLTPKRIAAIACLALAIGGLLGKELYLIEARWAHDSLAAEYEDPGKFESRGYYLRIAQVILDDRPFSGVGLNNWSYWVSKKYGALVGTPYEDYDDLTYKPNKEDFALFHYAAPAHCLTALTLGELGVPGLLILLLLWARWFQMGASFLWPRMPDATRRLAVGFFFGTCGVFLQSITEWAYRQEHIYMPFHILLGALASLYWMKKQEIKQGRLEKRALFERELETPRHYEPAAV